MARGGLSDIAIAKTLGVSYQSFANWKKKHPEVRRAVLAARKERKEAKDGDPLKDFVIGNLPEDLRDDWEYIQSFNTNEDNGPNINLLRKQLQGREGRDRALQALWLHAWFHTNFVVSEACRRVGVTQTQVNTWMNDPTFADLHDAMHRIKGDFYESALNQGVKDGVPALIALANKTYNRDRGYGEKIDVNMSGSVDHNHLMVDLSDLNLPVETLREVVAAVREKKKQEALELKSQGVDVSAMKRVAGI